VTTAPRAGLARSIVRSLGLVVGRAPYNAGVTTKRSGRALAGQPQPDAVGGWSVAGIAAALAVACAMTSVLRLLLPAGATREVDLPALSLGLASLALCGAVLWRSATDKRTGAAASWPASWAALAFAASIGVATAFATDPAAALFGDPFNSLGAVQLLSVAGAVLAGALLRRELGRWLGIALPVVVVAQIAAVAVQVVQASDVTGTMANSSNMGQMVVLALPVLAHGLWTSETPWRSWRMALALLGAAALVVAQSWAAAGAVALWLVVRAAWRVVDDRRSGASMPRRIVDSMLLLGGVAALVAGGYRVLASPSALGGRWEFWRSAWTAFLRSPLIGYGPDSFRVTASGMAPAASADGGVSLVRGFAQVTIDPHNGLAWIVTALGLVGLAAVVWAVAEAVRNVRRQGPGATGGLAEGVALYAVTLVVTPAPVQTLLLAALMLGAAMRPTVRAAATGTGRRCLPAVAPVTLVLVAGLAASVVTAAYAGTRMTLAPPGDGITPAQAARSLSVARGWALDPYLHYNASLSLGFAGGEGRVDLEEARRAVALAPHDPFYVLELARAQDSYGDPGAAATFLRAIELFPRSYDFRVEYAAYLTRVPGRAAEALAVAENAMRLAPDGPEAYEAAVAAAGAGAVVPPATVEAWRATAVRLRATGR
jgi:hypothetical protein